MANAVKESLIERVKNMLSAAVLQKDIEKMSILKVLIGETQRLKEPVPTDKQVVNIVKKLIEGNKETLKYKHSPKLENENSILSELLPPTMNEQDIKQRLVALNLKGLSLSMATGMSMKKLKETGVDFDSGLAIKVINELTASGSER